jgi:hypothetical protein
MWGKGVRVREELHTGVISPGCSKRAWGSPVPADPGAGQGIRSFTLKV